MSREERITVTYALTGLYALNRLIATTAEIASLYRSVESIRVRDVLCTKIVAYYTECSGSSNVNIYKLLTDLPSNETQQQLAALVSSLDQSQLSILEVLDRATTKVVSATLFLEDIVVDAARFQLSDVSLSLHAKCSIILSTCTSRKEQIASEISAIEPCLKKPLHDCDGVISPDNS